MCLVDDDSLLVGDVEPSQTAVLLDELERELEQLVAWAERDASYRRAAMEGESFLSRCLIYTGAFLTGLADQAAEIWDVGAAVFSGAGEALMSPSGRPVSWSALTSAIVDETGMAAAAASRAVETIRALASDPLLWDVLLEFQSDFIAALHSTRLTEAAGGLGLSLLLSLVSGGAAGAAAGLGLARMGTLLAKIARLLERLIVVRRGGDVLHDIPRLQRTLERMVDKYLHQEGVISRIKEVQDTPLVAAAVWLPRVRATPFFAVSNRETYRARELLPEIRQLVDATRSEALTQWTTHLSQAGEGNPAGGARGRIQSQHGYCSEVVALSKALYYLKRRKKNRRVTAWQRRFRFGVSLSVDIRLKGDARSDRPQGGTQAFARANHPPTLTSQQAAQRQSAAARAVGLPPPRYASGGVPTASSHKRPKHACPSCQVILGRLKIADAAKLL